MKRGILAVLLALALILGMVPVGVLAAEETAPVPIVEGACSHKPKKSGPTVDAARPQYSGKLINITPQRVEDTFAYLDELYVQKYPEAALLVNTGTREDREVLKKLAQTITKGCTTDTEKANAIDAWLRRNIVYEVNTSAFASDTFYRRTGNCLSYANLMQFLLRSLGVPAVVGDGWRGNMAESTVDLFGFDGHAWCFVRLDNQWVMYDPLWIEGGTTDRDYMAKWVYFDTVEFVTPASDSDNLPPEAYDKPKAYYSDGRAYCWSEFLDNEMGALFMFVNNQSYAFVTNQNEPDEGISDGWMLIDSDFDKTQMQRGDAYFNSWMSYGDYNQNQSMSLGYAHANGMMIDGAVMTLHGQDYLMRTNQSFPILADEDDYCIMDGLFTLKPGYEGKFLEVPWQDGAKEDCIITWENHNPEIATVDQNGIITCYAEGYADFMVTLRRLEQNGEYTQMGAALMSVQVSDEARVPNYEDKPGHTHEYSAAETVSPTCGAQGYTVYRCDCGDYYLDNYVDATQQHVYADYKDTSCDVCGYERIVEAGVVPVYRLYNPYTGEHLLTGGEQEKNALLAAGWHLDGVAWNAPENGLPVYRLYNPYDDWHTYTVSETEKDTMIAAGWKLDGPVSCAAGTDCRPIYRLFNPYVKTNYHLFTAGVDEMNMLVNAGWILEGIAWYAAK